MTYLISDYKRRRFVAHAGKGVASYASVLQDTYGADEVWPLVDISSGTTIHAFVNSNRDGTLTGWDLQNAAGPVTGTLAPYSDGVNDDGDIYTTNLSGNFDGAEGSIFGWGKVESLSVWTEGTERRLFRIKSDNTNFVQLWVDPGAGGRLQYQRRGGGTFSTVNYNTNETDWFSFGLSWSESSDEVKAYFNGSQVGSTQTSLGTWDGSGLDSDETVLLCIATGNTPWHGWGSYFAIKFASVWTPTQFQNMHNDASTAGAD